MANEYDPYREALVVEESTVWPDEYDGWDESDKEKVGVLLHASPDEAAEMRYERQHTGFSRVITVTAEDLERVGVHEAG